MRRLLLSISLSFGLLVALARPGEAAPKTATVTIKTNFGPVKVELDGAKAPVSVDNFLKYVDDKFYDGTIFHRVIGNFMIQGGGFTPDMKQKTTRAPIKNEATNGLSNLRGTIAMARTNDPNSATAQFYVNVVDNKFLDARPGNAGYAVFGKVVSGMEVVDKIKGVATGVKGGMPNVPNQPVVIESIRRDK
jgi:cyclophilin family peptidyl-prolyl cis-trans isomerase